MENIRAKILSLAQKDKKCSACKAFKPLIEFYRRGDNKDSHQSRCKECVIKVQKVNGKNHQKNQGLAAARRKKFLEKVKADPERQAKYLAMKAKWNKSEKYFDNYFKKRFGVSLATVKQMLAHQHNLCGNIGCGEAISLFPQNEEKKAVVDHDHATGKVRALMCFRCNSLLGHLEKNRNLVFGLLSYLEKFSS